MQARQQTQVQRPRTAEEALATLAQLGVGGAVLGGATWIMRAPIRHEPMKSAYVSVDRVEELHRLDIGTDRVEIGGAVTHARLAEALAGLPELAGLASAAGDSANPAVRQAATVGGNLCTAEFAAADLVPALLCRDAEVEILTVEGRETLSLDAFLALRTALAPVFLLTAVRFRRNRPLSAHARLPQRKAGDYPVAIVSAALEQGAGGTIGSAAIAVGSVEAVARRWRSLERAVEGLPIDAGRIGEVAQQLAGEFVGREGPEAPSWYRSEVLPALVRRAFARMQQQTGENRV